MNPPYIPATALGGDLLAPCLPVTMEWHADDDPSRWVSGVIITIEEARDGTRVIWYSIDLYVGFDNRSPVFLRLDPRRPEVAHRVADVLRSKGREVGHLLPVALGGRQGDVKGACPTPDICSCEDNGQPVGHAPIRRTTPAADVSAVLLAASVAGVEAERGVVRGLVGAWHTLSHAWGRSNEFVLVYNEPRGWQRGWRIGYVGRIIEQGPETGPEGRAAADAALLRLGYAYLDPAAPFGVVVPTFDLENER